MARVWASKKEIDTAIDTLKVCQVTIGKIPFYLKDQYSKSLVNTRRGLAQHFYERLAQEIPEFLADFAEVQPEGKEEETGEVSEM